MSEPFHNESAIAPILPRFPHKEIPDVSRWFGKTACRVGSRTGTALRAAAGNARAESEAGGTNGSRDTWITYTHTDRHAETSRIYR